jgi:hypothetical protein
MLRALPCLCAVSRAATSAHSCFQSCHAGRFGKRLVQCFASRQVWHHAPASPSMNKTAISPDALNRFRVAASEYKQAAKSRASRLLTLKDDIAALRKRGISYRAISELLIQNGIPASDTCVTNFCHRVLKERLIRKSSKKRRGSLHAKRGASSVRSPSASIESTSSPPSASPQKPSAVTTETTTFVTRGPRIAKIEQLPPGETI